MSPTDSGAPFGDEHARRYLRTGREVGRNSKSGAKILLLTTTGRRSGEQRTQPLIYGTDESGTLALVASNSGAPDHPAWYRNLIYEPNVEVELLDEQFTARARTASDEERAYWWPIMTALRPDYEKYQDKADREIPVVLIERP
jgi:deazaflavin-dependent oxidoreductase (nitroreductase family)